MFEVGKWGKILDGEYASWYLFIEDDTGGSTGGFYIYTVKNPNERKCEGYDNWVENKTQLENYLSHLKIHIDWNLQNFPSH